MTHHTQLLNLIAHKIGAKVYIEIGVYNPDHNFNHIEVPEKIGVDPDPNSAATFKMSSDMFFFSSNRRGKKADLIFIDGLHHADQVKQDIENAWIALNPGGVIVLHDCNPPTESTTCVPRGKQREWCGDVYRTVCRIASPGFFTMDFDYGCTVIRKGKDPLVFHNQELTWEIFNTGRKVLLNLVSVEHGIEKINAWT